MKLSIITINYNHLDGLKNTFESVIVQTWKEYEWIIIDGGSTDGSLEFIQEHKSLFSYWCSEKDGGVYNAQNKGITHAEGEYIVFLNSGDIFASRVTLQIVFGENRKSDILFWYMMRKSKDGLPHNWPSMKSHLSWVDFYYDTLPHQSSYIKRELFEKYGGYDENYRRLADWKWFFDVVANHHATLEFIPYKLSVYECGGISEDEGVKLELEQLRKELFPSYISEKDLMTINDVHTIWSYPWSRFFFRVIRRMAHSYRWHCQKATFNRARADLDR